MRESSIWLQSPRASEAIGGGLRTGRFVQYKGVSHNNLLVSILNLFGDTRTTFGEAKYCTGPLTGLT